mmetsp:Transcript_63361/g.181792  ORF Transcript_63361/g.181792 Transcript_63361/m.181792 type:complete len:207 (+) Transcript_63361:32-652(+)
MGVQARDMNIDDDMGQLDEQSLHLPLATQRRPPHGGFPNPAGWRNWDSSATAGRNAAQSAPESGGNSSAAASGWEALRREEDRCSSAAADRPPLKREFMAWEAADAAAMSAVALAWGSTDASRPFGLCNTVQEDTPLYKRQCLGFPLMTAPSGSLYAAPYMSMSAVSVGAEKLNFKRGFEYAFPSLEYGFPSFKHGFERDGVSPST